MIVAFPGHLLYYFSRVGSRMISEGAYLIKLACLLYVFGNISLSKQCRPRSDAAERILKISLGKKEGV